MISTNAKVRSLALIFKLIISLFLRQAKWVESVPVYIVSAGEYVMGPTCCDFDGPMAWAFVDQRILAYSANQKTYLIANGTTIALGILEGVAYTGLGPSDSETALDHCGAWLNTVHWDKTAGVLRGYYHEEWRCDYAHNFYTNKSVAYAESTDSGRTFSKPGHPDNAIITAPNSTTEHQTGEGDHTVVNAGDYLYLYFRDWSTFNIGVARATVESGGKPGTWKKFYKGQFSEPGLRGQASSIENMTGTSVFYSESKQQFVSVGHGSNANAVGSGVRLSFSNNGLDWTMMELPLVHTDGYEFNRTGNPKELVAYTSLCPTGSSADIGDDFYLFYTYLQPGETMLNRYLGRKRVLVKEVPLSGPVDPSAFGASFSSYILSTLAVLHSNDVSDTWVTTALVPPTRFYMPTGNVLPALATAHWTDGNIQHKQFHQANHWVRLCQRWLRRVGGGEWCSTFQQNMISQPSRQDENFADVFMYALYDCVSSDGRDHFVSKDKACNGQQEFLRILGYVTSVPTSLFPVKSAPLYKCFDPSANDHRVSARHDCSDCGGEPQELLGYGFLPPS